MHTNWKRKRLLLAVVLALALLASACGSKSAIDDFAEAPQAAPADAAREEAFDEGAAPDAKSEAEAGGSSTAAMLHSGNIDPNKQKIIRTASVTLQTKQFEEVVSSLSEKAVQQGGYLQSAQVEGTDGDRNATITLRIPYNNFDAFLQAAKESAKVVQESVSTDDVSGQYFDSQARLKSLQIQLERLESIMAASATLEDVLRLENEIADIRYQIESLQGNLNGIDDKVRYSTVTVSVYETTDRIPTTIDDPNFGERVRIAFYQTGQFALDFAQGLIVVLIRLLPLLIFLAILIPVILVVRKRRKARKAEERKQAHDYILPKLDIKAFRKDGKQPPDSPDDDPNHSNS